MTEGQGGSGDFFGRIPLFREFARLMATATGPVNWELARQVAVATAAGAEDLGMMPQLPRPAAAPDPGEARSWDDRLRLAELWVDPVTSLPGPGVALVARPVNRPDWAEAVLGGFAPLVEPGARRVAEALGTGAGMGPPGVGDMVGRVGGLVAGLQVGTLVGQLARSVLGQYELAMPAPDPAKVLLVPENVAAFEQSADLPGDQLRLWLACHQVAGQRLLAGVPWLPEQLRRVVDDVALQTEPDASQMMDRLQSLDMANPEALQELLAGGGEGLLGPPSAALQAATGRLEVLLALTAGYAMAIAGRALEGRLPGLAAIEAAVGRRDADPQSPARLFALLLRADPDRAAASRGERFCREVLAATDIEGLDRAWSHPENLPTAEELDVPGRWLERVGLIGGDEVDLDEGLRALLESEEPGPADGPGEPDDEERPGGGRGDPPARELVPVLLHALGDQEPAGPLRQRVAVDQAPERGRVVGHGQVGELVDEHVVADPRRPGGEPVREADGAVVGGAGAVPGPHVPHPADRARLDQALQVAAGQQPGPPLQLGVAGHDPAGAPLQALQHGRHPVVLLPPAHPGREQDHHRLPLAVGGDGLAPPGAADHLDRWPARVG